MADEKFSSVENYSKKSVHLQAPKKCEVRIGTTGTFFKVHKDPL